MSRVSTRTLALASSVAALSMTLSACSLLGGNTSAFNVEVGQCVQLPNGSTISGLRVKMCVWLGVSRGLDLAFLNAD